jgi:hypothetical protein
VSDGYYGQGDTQLRPVASSTSDATVRDAAKHASVPIRRCCLSGVKSRLMGDT